MKNIIKIILIFTITLPLFLYSGNVVFAEHDSDGIYIQRYNQTNARPLDGKIDTEDKVIKNEDGSIYLYYMGSAGRRQVIFKVTETNEGGEGDFTDYYTTAIYCLKNGLGLGAGTSTEPVHYTEYFDLKKGLSTIGEPYSNSLPQGTNYNKLIWLLDNMCMPYVEESRNTLLEKADVDIEEFVDLFDDENRMADVIDAIQQTAIWKLTNAGDVYEPSANLFYASMSETGSTYPFGNDIYPTDFVDDPFAKIYNFLTGFDSHGNYDFTEEDTITFDKSRATLSQDESYYYVGPYKVNSTNRSNFLISVTLRDHLGSDISNPVVVKTDKVTELSGTSLTEKIVSGLGQDFYIRLPINTSYKSVTLGIKGSIEKTNLTYWSVPASAVSINQPIVFVTKEEEPMEDSSKVDITTPEFDLALRKFISSRNGVQPSVSREPEITQEYLRKLATGEADLDNGKTATKTHTKEPLEVKTGDKVIYTIRIYNEGQVDGKATEITDYLPDGLEMIPKSSSATNRLYGWKMYDESNQETEDPTKAKYIKTDYLKNTNIPAFELTPTNGKYSIIYADVQVECKVVATTSSTNEHLKNVAEITAAENHLNLNDRDSTPKSLTNTQKDNYEPGTSTRGKGYEDDDDYEDLYIPGKFFDLSLRKFMIKVNDSELKKDGKYEREPVVDLTPLTTGSATTANYNHKKKAVSVSANDEVIYIIRVYNEGQVDGYVDEIVDHLPPELEFVNDEFNAGFGWTIDSSDSTQRTIRTSFLSKANDVDNVIKAFKKDETTQEYPKKLDYKEVQIKCKVRADAPTSKEITNIAEITRSSNDEGLADRDNEALVTLPSDENLPAYRGNVDNEEDLSDSNYFYKGQKNTKTFEDDDDFEKVILEKFDLALRKFITGVNDEKITNREPEVDTSKYGTIVDGKEITTFEYKHTKDPVRVCQNDIVTYTIRVYNEGTKSGYAEIIKDDIPDGLEFLPNHDINKTYNWKLLDENGNDTTDVKSAKYISTDYLSKANNEEIDGMPADYSKAKYPYLKGLSNLLLAYNGETMKEGPDHLDVKVAFKVTEPNTSDRIITNQAQISEDADEDGNDVTDIDSTPNQWIEGEDDQDVEHIYVKYFDLALRKWVTQAIVIEDGVQKVMETGHYAEQDPEPIVKVEVNKQRINNTVIKFKYSIRITNEGEIAGYATEISDYIPQGLEFNKADNPDWTEKNGKIVTNKLKNTLLEPGQAAFVDVILTWVNDENNMGVMVNVAEISEDKNDSNTPDIDSTPNNKKEGEDDIDDAPVALSVVTGSAPTYLFAIGTTLILIAGGLFLIKKYVI